MVLASKEGPVVSRIDESHVTVALRELYTTITHYVQHLRDNDLPYKQGLALKQYTMTQGESPIQREGFRNVRTIDRGGCESKSVLDYGVQFISRGCYI